MTFSNELNECDYECDNECDYECDNKFYSDYESNESQESEESDFDELNYREYEYVFNPLAKEFIPLAKEFIPLAKEFIPLTKEFIPLAKEFIPLIKEFIPLTKEFIPLTKEFIPLTKELNPSAKEFVPCDPFEYSDPEVTIKHPGFTMGVKKTYGAKIGKITCEGLVFDIINDEENNVAILTIPNRVYDAFFPLTMSILQVVRYYFGDKRIIADDSIYMPMNEAPFCNIIVE